LFNKWIKSLEDYGYYNTWQVLNAKDYGVPQNRERVFLVSIRRDLLDPSPTYYFPKPFKLEKRLKDVLEEKVDEKYYLSDKLIETLSRDCKGFKAMKPSTPPI
jgi:DNA (cytosine-5)-methyltransferase 1